MKRRCIPPRRGKPRCLKSAACSTELQGMSTAAVATGDFHDRGVEPRRFQVRSQAHIARPLATVWGELERGAHPAWSEHPDGHGPAKRTAGSAGLVIGSAQITLLPANSLSGVRSVLYTELKSVEPGRFLTTETIATGAFEQTETIRFLEHPEGGVMVECTAWISTVPMTTARAVRLQHNLERTQNAYLSRARGWTPGTPHQPVVIDPEPDDLQYLG